MKQCKEKKYRHKIPLIVGGVVLSICGLAVIPPIVDSCSRRLYKNTLNKRTIDFDNLGPNIVRK